MGFCFNTAFPILDIQVQTLRTKYLLNTYGVLRGKLLEVGENLFAS